MPAAARAFYFAAGYAFAEFWRAGLGPAVSALVAIWLIMAALFGLSDMATFYVVRWWQARRVQP